MKNRFLPLVAGAILSSFAFGEAPAEILAPISGQEGYKVRTLETVRIGKYMGGFTRGENGEILTAEVAPPSNSSGASWGVTLNQKTAIPVRILADATVLQGNRTGEVLLYVDVSYMDGDHLWGQKAEFPNYPSKQTSRSVMIVPLKPIKHLSIYLMAKNDSSLRVKFLTPSLHLLEDMADTTLFDSIPVCMKSPLKTPAFLIRDVKTKDGFSLIETKSKDAEILVKKENKGDVEFYDVTLRNLKGADRALTLAWAKPLAGAKKIIWFDTPRTQQDISTSTRDCRLITSAPCGVNGYSSWPFIAASVDGQGIAIGFDPRLPAFSRLSLQAGLKLMYAAFDVALVPEKNSARLGFVAFSFDAKHGFRGALEKYQTIFPDLNEVKQKKQGNWMAFKSISKVENWEDFGFAIKEGEGETKWDDAHGITTYRYTEPTTWWMAIKGKDGRKQATMDECIAEAERQAKAGKPFAIAWKNCAIHDSLGRPCGRILDTPWCKGIVWNMNCAPGLGTNCEFAVKLGDAHFKKNYRGKFPESLDGEYVDSSEMYVTAAMDFNRANFKGMNTPLVFSSVDYSPCVFKGMMGYEYVRGAWERCRAVGRRTMANSTPHSWWWLAPYLDVLGSEVNWGHEGKWTPLSDSRLMYIRSICGAKPFCFLMNTDFNTFTYEMTDKYMQRALAYGMYPSFFSPVASSKSHYFSSPTYYNRDRPLFKKYLPLCIRVGEAGWRPVNRLVSSASPKVITEQFGEKYATVYNLDTKPVRVTLTSLKGETKAKELLSNTEWNFADGKYEVEIPAESVRVLTFTK